jgi:hypothetical protein
VARSTLPQKIPIRSLVRFFSAVYTQEQIQSSPRPTVMIGRTVVASGGHGPVTSNAPEGVILNLKAPASAPKYVKTIIALEFGIPETPWIGVSGDALTAKNVDYTHHLEHERPKIMDAIATVFGSHTADEVASVEGRDELKFELIEAINEHLHAEKVEAVYFEVFITQ